MKYILYIITIQLYIITAQAHDYRSSMDIDNNMGGGYHNSNRQTTYQFFGNQIKSSDGETTTIQGNEIRSSSGRHCVVFGNTMKCNEPEDE